MYHSMLEGFSLKSLDSAASLSVDAVVDLASPVEQLKARVGHALNVVHMCAHTFISLHKFTATLVSYVTEVTESTETELINMFELMFQFCPPLQNFIKHMPCLFRS